MSNLSRQRLRRSDGETAHEAAGHATCDLPGAPPRSDPDFGPPNPIAWPSLAPRQNHKVAHATARAKDVRAAPTAIYLHGIGNHPREQALTARWDRALFGRGMAGRTRMAYWVDRARYPQPEACECIEPGCACQQHAPVAPRVLSFARLKLEVEVAIRMATPDPARRRFLRDISALMVERAGASAADAHGALCDLALPDALDFLFDPARRRRMEAAFLARLRSAVGPCVVVAHSLGALIAYDVLRQLRGRDIEVPLFVTLGSPLGLAPLRRAFQAWAGQRKLPFPACVRRWLNVTAAGDVLAFDPALPDDIDLPAGRAAFEHRQIGREDRDRNPLFNGNPHASLGYLTSRIVQEGVRAALRLGALPVAGPPRAIRSYSNRRMG